MLKNSKLNHLNLLIMLNIFKFFFFLPETNESLQQLPHYFFNENIN